MKHIPSKIRKCKEIWMWENVISASYINIEKDKDCDD